MIESPRFDPRRDIQQVMPGLALNVNEAIRTGVVTDTGTELHYNGIEDPDCISGRVCDVFSAINERNSVVTKEFARIKADVSTSVNPKEGEGE